MKRQIARVNYIKISFIKVAKKLLKRSKILAGILLLSCCLFVCVLNNNIQKLPMGLALWYCLQMSSSVRSK